MMARFSSSIFLLGLGAAFLWMTLTGYRGGELRAGSGLLKPYRRNRDDNPIGFHFYLAMYFCCGVGLCVWGLLALIGMAPPLKWR
jgi:hypothetical protein